MRKIIFLSLWVLVFSLFLLNLPAQSATQRFADPQGRFSFDFQGTWSTSDVSAYPNVLGRYQVTGQKNGNPSLVAEVVITRLADKNLPAFDKYVAAEVKKMRTADDITSRTPEKSCLIDQRQAVWMLVSFTALHGTDKATKRLVGQYYINGDDAIWGISIIATPDQKQLILQIKQGMEQSFRFTPVKEAEPAPQKIAVPPVVTEPELEPDPVPEIKPEPEIVKPEVTVAEPVVIPDEEAEPLAEPPIDAPVAEQPAEPEEEPQLLWSPKRKNR